MIFNRGQFCARAHTHTFGVIKKIRFIYLLRQIEREQEWEREREREKERERKRGSASDSMSWGRGRGRENLKQTPCRGRAWQWGLIPQCWDHELSWNQESDAYLCEPPRSPKVKPVILACWLPLYSPLRWCHKSELLHLCPRPVVISLHLSTQEKVRTHTFCVMLSSSCLSFACLMPHHASPLSP